MKDLPDPLSDAPGNATGASADDMIAQMADEAIDQLIADAERDKPSRPVSLETVAETPIAPAPLPPVEKAASPEPHQEAADALAGVLDPVAVDKPRFVDPLESDDVNANPVAGAASVAPAVVAPAPSMPESRDELKALLDEAERHSPRGPRPGLLLRPLVWLNAPFAGVPASVRDALGQIGIVTLMNAIAVLLYVLVFRR